ncbi:unnamed protein product [Thlaspi arvense]|uniref:Uncharacterized protein n=1 Tax=Thlaspi arvense TaxID=13288 RepID=A0AAU9SU93_THLAR|nr:unnamed protein product [Thlaspi arvense]
MKEKQVKDGVSRVEKWLRENGVRYLSEAEGKKIAKSRVLGTFIYVLHSQEQSKRKFRIMEEEEAISNLNPEAKMPKV